MNKEFCEVCNTPLSACGTPAPDGEPSMECKVCQLREALRLSRDENMALRKLFPLVLQALNSGNCSPDCTLQFLQHIPTEVKLVIGNHRREIELLKADRNRVEYWQGAALAKCGDGRTVSTIQREAVEDYLRHKQPQ